MAPDPQKTPSAIDALGEAISHMRQKLFPFNFVGWITLGFVALLESCGSGSGTSGFRNSRSGLGDFGSAADRPIRLIETAFAWIAAHMIWVVFGLMAVMVLSLVIMWLRSRAVFVYIDNVGAGNFDLVRPWGQHGALADSFFVVSLILQGVTFVLSVMLLALGAFFAIWANTHGWPALTIALGALPILFLFVLSLVVAGLLGMALRDFVAPIQMARNLGAQDASAVFASMLSANPGLFIGYAILKFVGWIAIGIVMFMAMCLTCCIALFPLVNQTLFQPIYYAERAWSLKLLAQLGEDVFPKAAPKAPLAFSQNDAPTEPIDLSEFRDEFGQS